MGFRPLAGATGFALGASLRAAAISVLGFGVLLAIGRGYAATALVLGGVLILVVLDLVRSTTAADRVLTQFVEGLTAEGHERPAVPRGLPRLKTAIERALAGLTAARAERQRRIDFLEALADTVPAALLVADDVDVAVSVNRAATLNLGVARGPLRRTSALGPAVVERLLGLPAGAREIVRLPDGRAMLAQTAHFSVPGGGRRRLIALQGVARELDAVELKAWQDLTRVLAHEMMNSLTPILSLSESVAARLDHGAPATDETRAALEVIRRRSAGLMSFVERYRRVADLPAAAKELVRVDEVFARLERLLAPGLEAAGVDYASQVAPAGLSLQADPDLLEQALINLVKNAADAVSGRAGGTVRLACGVEDDQVVFRVADNGPGVPADDPEAVFVPFFTTKPGGSGVGLTLCRQIAIAHGGRIEHAHREGGGAEFGLYLPAIQVGPTGRS